MPNLFVIAGPNGAGKSTSAPELLVGRRRVHEFVNADVIASQHGVSDIEAGRLTLGRLSELAAAGRDIAFETTLASHALLSRIRSMQLTGYVYHLFFFWLPSADAAVNRVAARVRSGGHSIPENVIRRRYARGLQNYFNHHLAAADSWVLFDNSSRPPARRIAWRDVGENMHVSDNRLWSKLTTHYMKPRAEQQIAAAAPEKLWDSEDLLKAVNRAVIAALRRHKTRGESVVIWRDGQVVWLRPEEIDV